MKTRSVHWSEGMLLLPHHFQAAHANTTDLIAASVDWTSPYGYGIREINIHAESLANFEFRISRVKARLRDGTLLAVPDNAHIEPLDLRPELAKSSELYIFLCVPEMVPGRPNALRMKGGEDRRLSVVQEDWDERAAASGPREIEFERYRTRLLASTDLHAPAGYDSLPVARIRTGAKAGAPPEIDPAYVPPILSCDCWPSLHGDILTTIRSRLGAFIKRYAETLRNVGGWTEANQPEIRRRIMKLNAVNQSYPLLTQFIQLQGLHPLPAYLELCRLVGQLSLFRSDWQPPDLPAYDHEDLGRIFRVVYDEIGVLIEEEREKYQRYDFLGVKEWMEVGLDPRWLAGRHDLYVGVRSDLIPRKLQALFRPEWLNWKLGSNRAVKQIFESGEKGCDLTLVTGVTTDLPLANDVTYYKIEQHGYDWDQVTESRILALYINPRLITGDFVGRNTIRVRDPSDHNRDLTFFLYVVEK